MAVELRGGKGRCSETCLYILLKGRGRGSCAQRNEVAWGEGGLRPGESPPPSGGALGDRGAAVAPGWASAGPLPPPALPLPATWLLRSGPAPVLEAARGRGRGGAAEGRGRRVRSAAGGASCPAAGRRDVS